MITSDLIDAWIHEIEARPESAQLILRQIGARLQELARQNEDLLAENIVLRSGARVEEYEQRLASLAYQLDLLKRQLGGDVQLPSAPEGTTPTLETLSLFIYNHLGQALRLEIDHSGLQPGEEIGHFSQPFDPQEPPPRLLATRSTQELLFTLDSGRSETHPATDFAPAEVQTLDWEKAAALELRGLEALVDVLPIGALPLYDFAVQVSRKGFIKKLPEAFFETCIHKGFVGSGVRLSADQSFALALCRQTERLVLVSYQGYVWSQPVADLPTSIEEAQRLGHADHVVGAFALNERASEQQSPDLLIITQTGKALHRQSGWIEDSNLRTLGQAAISKARRDSGVRVVGATAASPQAWGFALHRSGRLTVHHLGDLFAAGALLPPDSPDELLSFTALER